MTRRGDLSSNLLVVLLVLALIAGGALLFYFSGREPAPPAPVPAPAEPAPREPLPPVEEVALPDVTTSVRPPVAVPAGPAPAPAPPAAVAPPAEEKRIGGFRVTVRERADERPIAGASVDFYYVTATVVHRLRTDAEGVASADDLPRRTYAKVVISDDRHEPAEVLNVTVAPEVIADLGTIYLEPGAALSGQCRRPDGTGVAGVMVTARGGGTFNREQNTTERDRADAQTDAAGRYALTGLLPGVYWVSAVEPGLPGAGTPGAPPPPGTPAERVDRGPPGASADEGRPYQIATIERHGAHTMDFVLAPPVRLTGVFTRSGQPISQPEPLRIYTHEPAGVGPELPRTLQHVRTDAEGRFEIRVPAGTHQIIAGGLPFTVTVPPAERYEVRLDAGGSGVAFDVLLLDSTLFPRQVRVALRPAGTEHRPESWLPGYLALQQPWQSAPTGRVRVTAGPGTYTMVVAPSGLRYRTMTVVVPETGFVELPPIYMGDALEDMGFTFHAIVHGLPVEFRPDSYGVLTDQHGLAVTYLALMARGADTGFLAHDLHPGAYEFSVFLPTGRRYSWPVIMSHETTSRELRFDASDE